MPFFFAVLSLATVAFGARPFLSYPDTGIDLALVGRPNGTLPDLADMKALDDFEWVAERNLNESSWAFYRAGAGGEWSYRNNLESYGYAHVDGELNLVKAAAEENILYVASMHATKTLKEIAAAKADGQVTGHQFYNEGTDEDTLAYFQQVEAAGGKAILFTVDSAGDGNRHRAARWDVTSSDSGYTYATWDYYKHPQNLTSLPIIPKGIPTVEDAKLAISYRAPGIFLSNHGARQVDHVPSSLEVALEIYPEAPEIFQQTYVFADGGVRYGSDVLKLMALGVKAVGAARPFAFANVYGVDGVKKALQMMKHEIAIDCSNMGLNDVHNINSSYIKLNNPTWNGWYS
ncbi:hypothetical protein LQW54_000399 [Pestalotiopsis sp. IQ-011]